MTVDLQGDKMTILTEYMAAIDAAGLTAVHDEEGLMGRGLYVGLK
jgi:hypothetical protein